MPSKHPAIGDKSIAIALRYATGKIKNVSRGILAMQDCIETLEKANKEKAVEIKELKSEIEKYSKYVREMA